MFSKKNFLILEIFYFSLLLLGKIQCRTLLIKNSANESDELSIKCPILTECPLKPEFCQDDVNCNPDAVCCASPCGKICTQQLFTGCQTLRMATTRRAKSLGVSGKSLRMPRCTKQGNFEEIQCNNEIINSNCWCVDQVGFEVAGTRAPTRNLVNCTAQKNRCAEATCRMFCPWGFALTADGCPKCQCRDPCDEIQCPNALECHLEELSCADPPCPPVPTCKKGRSLENLCPVGDPLRINETIRPFLCGNDIGKPTCPPLYQCLVQTGNEYGVCCPNSLKIQKTGQCPAKTELKTCGMPCVHDLECPSIQKCCGNENCGQHQSHCTHPENVTECFHQRKLAELLSVNEQIGRGYLPQCLENGEFAARQCSRNNLVCWCVDDMGNKIKGSMGAPETVNCQNASMIEPAHARALQCVVTAECPAICEYGFRLDENGCPTCKCDNPCDGFRCPEDEECVAVRKDTCDDFLCPALPVCRPKAIYANPCDSGTPLTDSLTGAPVACALKQNETGKICPEFFECTSVLGSTQSVCCPTVMENPEESAPSSQTMCQYLRDFHDSMEGTSAEMSLALSIPQCDHLGNFQPTQCDEKSSDCWCVNNYGTEIPNTRSSTNSSNCLEIRSTMDCLDGSCRLGCDYGFILSKETGCPTCQCRDPCSDVKCQNNQQCQLVEVNCSDHYCPPVPACLPKKTGQCPYLVPIGSAASCDLECHSDLTCDGTMKCCSNGCGTQCTEPLNLTTCQHQKLIGQHRAHDQGIPEGKLYIPQCDATGNFKRQQCHLGNKECWCVDENGFELSKTRTRDYNNLTCDNALVSQSTEQCPLWECKRDCAHGYEFDEKGCRMCSCTDPCRNISCRNPGESCRLVDVECVTSPCPAIPMCLPEKTNPCQFGAPLKLNQGELFVCGPQNEENLCPSSHKCEISPVGEYAVCCPKPRTVCFEPMNSGDCRNGEEIKNLTRFYFNSRINKCEMFNYSGCEGNHNNFHNLKICEAVCPVLSQCERLREKNQHLSEKYKKPTFVPRCDQETGNWEKIQCLDHVGVCWCATPKGETLKGTLTRSAEPECNFRQARNRKMLSEADLVLDELINQLASLDEINEKSADDSIPEETSIDRNDRPEVNFSLTRCESLGGQCDKDGKFLPTQCEETVCWCVDEAGNQLAETVTFEISQKTCFPKPVEKVEITLGILGQFTDVTVVPIINEINELILKQLNGFMEEIRSEFENNLLFIKFALIGYNKIDVAYKFEQLVMSQKLGLAIDLTKYRVNYKPLLSEIDATTKGEILPLQQREILTNSPVSFVAPYHTALIILAAASAFIISILLVLVLLYRRKVNHIIDEKEKLSSIRRISIEKSAKIHEEFQEKCV